MELSSENGIIRRTRSASPTVDSKKENASVPSLQINSESVNCSANASYRLSRRSYSLVARCALLNYTQQRRGSLENYYLRVRRNSFQRNSPLKTKKFSSFCKSVIRSGQCHCRFRKLRKRLVYHSGAIHVQCLHCHREIKVNDSNENKKQNPPKLHEMFSAKLLGKVTLSEDQMNNENKRNAVSTCIRQFSQGNFNSKSKAQAVFLMLEGTLLKLVEPKKQRLLASYAAYYIKLWIVGSESPREFAFVARDLNPSNASDSSFICYVLKCDIEAAVVSQAFKLFCSCPLKGKISSPQMKRLTMESTESSSDSELYSSVQRESVTMRKPSSSKIPVRACFKVEYLGECEVKKPDGIDIINNVFEKLAQSESETVSCDLHIMPSKIIGKKPSEIEHIFECKIDRLTFVGIGRNPENLAFISFSEKNSDSSKGVLLCRAFKYKPHSGEIARSIELASKTTCRRQMMNARRRSCLTTSNYAKMAIENASRSRPGSKKSPGLSPLAKDNEVSTLSKSMDLISVNAENAQVMRSSDENQQSKDGFCSSDIKVVEKDEFISVQFTATNVSDDS